MSEAYLKPYEVAIHLCANFAGAGTARCQRCETAAEGGFTLRYATRSGPGEQVCGRTCRFSRPPARHPAVRADCDAELDATAQGG
jgi:hypothetical protein